MPKTQTDLVTEIRERLDEATARFWSEVEIRKWVNEGARDIARRAEILQATATVAYAAGDQEKTLAADVIRIYRAEWNPTGTSQQHPLEFAPYSSMDAIWGNSQKISEGTPAYYTLWGFPPSLKVLLFPKPAAGGTLKYFYYRLPADLATDGTAAGINVDVPEGWWDLIVYYAEYTALRKDGDARWQEAKLLYEETLDELKGNLTHWSDQADALQFGSSYLPGWLVGGEW